MSHAPTDEGRRQARFLAGLTGALGVLHLVKPEPFDGLIPRALPLSPRFWTIASGWVELLVAAGLLLPATRRASGRAASLLYVAVFPGNVVMARRWRDKPWPLRLVALARLPYQADLIRRAELVHREG